LSETSITKAVDEYKKTRPKYEALSEKVESIIKDILNSNNINYYSINNRTKSIEKYKEKATREKYKDPTSEIMDMSGIRIITYTNSDAKKVYDLINTSFDILPEHSIDKSKELGIDKVGYQSIHCVGILGKDRINLPEYKIFKGMCFEIQIRTILQHAWAEFEHDRNYKFAGVLPDEIRRRLLILSGSLELIDKEFDRIALDIDEYTQAIEYRWKIGDLNIPINTTSLKEYMNLKFSKLVEIGIDPNITSVQIIEDLYEMNIDTLEKLDKIIPKDYIEKKGKFLSDIDSLGNIVYDILIINHYKDYLLPNNKPGLVFSQKDIELYKKYDIDLRKEIKTLKQYIVDET